MREMAIAAVLLGGFALAGAGLVAFTHLTTAERIAENRRAGIRAQLNSILPASSYDNRIVEDTRRVTDRALLGSDRPLTIYRARRNGEPVAAVLTVVAPNGYNGAIRLLVGVHTDGTLAGVRVVSQQETPGLGDRIESSKTDWLQQFDGRSLGDPAEKDWAVKKDGGAFDQLTGATITPRAVVGAIRKALIYYRTHRDTIFQSAEAS